MPKIIPNIREQMLVETRKQIEEKGYAATTMRSVSGACGFAVGTMYNYFESKEVLVATFVFEDLESRYVEMQALPRDNVEEFIGGAYRIIIKFMDDYYKFFADPDAAKAFRADMKNRRNQYRNRLADMLVPILVERSVENPEIVARFLAESMIGMAADRVDFDVAYSLLKKIIA